MLFKGYLPRVIYHHVYEYTKINAGESRHKVVGMEYLGARIRHVSRAQSLGVFFSLRLVDEPAPVGLEGYLAHRKKPSPMGPP